MTLHSNILGEGKPFLILHGFLGMSDNWKTLGNRFAAEGHQVHLVDQRNHGRSFHHNEFNYDVLAEDVRRYCEIHNLEDIVLLGHSMGGKTAMHVATEYPDLVSKLLVADISPRFYPIHHDAILNGLSAMDFSEIKSRGQADKFLSQYVPELGTRMFLLKNLYWVEKGQLGLRINLPVLKDNVAEVGESLPMLAKFENQTLFLRGDKSEYVMPSDNKLIMQHFPKSEIVTVSNAGHWLHAENPNEFYDAVMKFATFS
ncbi:alpha/beta fold hydrolase [Psychroserpens sp.]|uniref:alpha/beta fold hydrolase n=1 Tax=Psychroserpens sp. TaxID=2020870 RepID=UPI001B07D6FA|nr:alpha/beta fold hydrolase [Psychroserpens sp.]MBO6607874.1 alpha/beta fold hydrolase [Psychroserpens sp.]MBO6630971.1 alpha/beta fold hydrolase [Psychroserpens sp.]MBO6654999.1 alpha/beta fold hydrolase [Psychroserpens sp.]MBO6682927.1 alpha/beta fold hydrolase [Psychroserpens sp.]MBO6751232.1 alpha/beta fold hydrolase [Psychroserpens sp.]